MEPVRALERLLSSAAVRLCWTTLLQSLSRALLVGAVLACLVLGWARLWPLPHAGWAACGIVAAATIAGIFVGMARRADSFRAAMYLDNARGLHERLSTAALCLHRSDAPATEVIRDAAAHVDRIDLQRYCPLSLPREAPAVFALALLAVALLGIPAVRRELPDGAAIARNEIHGILAAIGQVQAGAPSRAAQTLDTISKPIARAGTPAEAAKRMAAALGMLERKTAQLKALSDVIDLAVRPEAREAIEAGDEQAIAGHARQIARKHLTSAQRDALQQALKDALQRADDPDVRRALLEAIDALERDDAERAAAAIEKIMLAVAAEVRLKQLEKLQRDLAQAKKRIDNALSGDSNAALGGAAPGDGTLKPTEAPPGIDPAFWVELPGARARAEDAVAAGRVPRRYRELVRRYFSEVTE